jgi:AraC-like DNA-binding protein
MWPSGLGEKWVASDAMCAATYDAPVIRRCTVPEDRVRFSDSHGPRPLDIVVRLAAPTLTHFRAVLEPEHRIVVARSWASLPKVIRCRHVDVVVVDPRADGTARSRPIVTMLNRYPTLPIIVYTTMAPEALRLTVALSAHGLRHVLLRGFDDTPHKLRAFLEKIPADAMAETILAALREPIARLPLLLAQAITQLFHAPHLITSVGDLATLAAMRRRRLDRWLERVGIAPAHQLITVARLVRAYRYMQDGYLLGEAAAKLGYSARRIMSDQMRVATGMLPSLLREGVSAQDLCTRLAALACRRAPTVAEQRDDVGLCSTA